MTNKQNSHALHNRFCQSGRFICAKLLAITQKLKPIKTEHSTMPFAVIDTL